MSLQDLRAAVDRAAELAAGLKESSSSTAIRNALNQAKTCVLNLERELEARERKEAQKEKARR